jgi:hypothetical protein
MNEQANIKAILLSLVGASEDLAASQAVVIAILRAQSKGKVSAADVRSATEQAKISNRRSYDKLRKAIAEISSGTQ